MGGSPQFTEQEVLRVFDDSENPREPLGTSEVADALGCSRRTAYEKLNALVERDRLATKQIGARARAWWRPGESIDQSSKAGTPEQSIRSDSAIELTTKEIIELEFESNRLAQPFVELGDENMSLSIDGFVRLPDGKHLQYWSISGVPGATVRALPEEFPTVEDVRLLRTHDETFSLEVKGTESSLASTVDDFDGTPVSTVLTDGAINFTAQFPASVDTTALLEAVQRVVSPDFELTSQRLVYTPRLFASIVRDALTDRQWTALQVAYFAGYYETPRESNGDELANQMGITRQTFNYHRRHAEEIVLSHIFESLSHNGIAESD